MKQQASVDFWHYGTYNLNQLDRALGARLREIPELFVSANKVE